jgi:septal ring factor EnvC (AmiA/AmiB activator)
VIQDQIAAVDQQIEQKKVEISKAGPASMDPSTGLTQNVIIIHDRNAELKALQDRRQNLERQLDNLADQGRRAGADPGWFR